MGPAAKPVAGQLIKLLSGESADLCVEAAMALFRIDPENHHTLESLTGLLKDPDIRMRRRAADYLGQIGPAAQTAVPVLLWLMREEDASTALKAAAALCKIDPRAAAQAGIR